MEIKIVIIIILSSLIALSIASNIVLLLKPISVASSKISLVTDDTTDDTSPDDCIQTLLDSFVPYYNENTPPSYTGDCSLDTNPYSCDEDYFNWAMAFYTPLSSSQKLCLYEQFRGSDGNLNDSFDDALCDNLSQYGYSQEINDAFCGWLKHQFNYFHGNTPFAWETGYVPPNNS
tara:strand:+ start:113 stop:637 length:525 start_codon:yes stop_codon:yes gene_type:complete